MKIELEQIEAVNVCLRHNIPFALFAFPGEENFRFFASLPEESGESPAFDEDDTVDTFFISFFDNDEPYTAGVKKQMDATEVMEYVAHHEDCQFQSPMIHPSATSTIRVSYDDAFRHVKSRLKRFGGKVVLSQHQALVSDRPLMDVAEEYFSYSGSTFRYVCFTPETGIWLGATPELLLKSEIPGNRFVSMSLAGTKLLSDDTPWDAKNVEEHQIVTMYIDSVLKELGLEVTVEDICELRLFNLKHLCNVINARGDVDPRVIMQALSPTPAVAGFPQELALAEIDTLETHLRRCYGGYVGVRLNGLYSAYVNLRCAFVAPVFSADSQCGYLYNLYSGGGIVGSSECDTEWEEAMAKISLLRSIITKGNSAGGGDNSNPN